MKREVNRGPYATQRYDCSQMKVVDRTSSHGGAFVFKYSVLMTCLKVLNQQLNIIIVRNSIRVAMALEYNVATSYRAEGVVKGD